MVYLFQTIANFRDLGTSIKSSKLCPNIAFRSATLDHASEEELHALAAGLNVTTILDLRSEVEADLSKHGKAFNTFPVVAANITGSDIVHHHQPRHHRRHRHRHRHHHHEESVTVMERERLQGEEEAANDGGKGASVKKTVMINFAGFNFRKNAVWKPAPLKTKLKIITYYLSSRKDKAVKTVGQEVLNPQGLEGLYRNFVDYCKTEINAALQTLADPDNYPILIHCTQGKDRTGLVTAMALAAVGTDFEDIIEDYGRSQEGLEPVRAEMVAAMAKDGLDASFADSPPEVMRVTLQYITTMYGSIEKYLDLIGFDATCRKRLCKLLHQPSDPKQNQDVEDVLTQVVDKPVLQNTKLTDVLTPAADVEDSILVAYHLNCEEDDDDDDANNSRNNNICNNGSCSSKNKCLITNHTK